MKKISIIISAFLSLFLLAGCGEKLPDLEDRIVEEGETQTSYTGMIEPIEIDIYQDGTHKIVTKDGEIIIQSATVNLGQYIGKKVTVSGSMQKLIDNKSEVFIVEAIQLEEAGDGESLIYENKRFGFRFQHPDLWERLEDTDGLTLRSNGVNWVTMEVFDTDTELDEFIAFYEIEDGTPVTIGGQRSVRYTDPREIRLYIPNPSKGKVCKITFDQSKEGADARKDFFYSLLESFTLLVSRTREGEKCGGEENLTCPEEYRCELESGEADAEGVCVPVDEEISDLDCPFIPAPSGCEDYEPASFNKDGCPTSYRCLDKPDELKEDDVSSVSDEPEKAPAPPSEEEDVVAVFSKYQDTILPAGAEAEQFEVVKAQELLAVVYTVDETTFRSVFSYELSADEYNFVRKAHYKKGEERDWVLVEGDEARILYDKTVIETDNGSGIQIIGKDMRLYENPHKDYSVQYPKNWYYRSFGSIENTVWTVGFAEKPLDSVFEALITLRILDEASAGKKEVKGDTCFIETPRDNDSHFLLEGALEYKDVMDEMADTIIQN